MPSNVAEMPLTLRWYRNRGRCLVIYGVLAVVLLGAALEIIGKSGAVWTVLGALAILVAIWLVAGAALAGFGVSRDALIVRSPLGTSHRVPWTQVASFTVSRPGQSERSESVVVAVRTDGRLLHTEGCTFGRGAKGHSRAQSMAAELNTDRLARLAGDAPATRSRAGHRSPSRLSLAGTKPAGIAYLLIIGIAVLGLGAYLLGSGAAALGPARRAAEGQGVHGSFVAVTEHCGKYGCSWTGNFVLPEGIVSLRNVKLNTDTGGMKAGQSRPALDTGDNSMVFPANNRRQWLQQVVDMAIGAALIVFGFLWIAHVTRYARRTGMLHRSLVSAAAA